MNLSNLNKGETATITAIKADKSLKQRFNSFGLIRGASIMVESCSLAKRTIKIKINKTQIALRTDEAKKIEVLQ